MLYNAENVALQSSQILTTFVLRAEISTTFVIWAENLPELGKKLTNYDMSGNCL